MFQPNPDQKRVYASVSRSVFSSLNDRAIQDGFVVDGAGIPDLARIFEALVTGYAEGQIKIPVEYLPSSHRIITEDQDQDLEDRKWNR